MSLYRIGADLDKRAPIDPYAMTPSPASPSEIDAIRKVAKQAAEIYASDKSHKRYLGYGFLNAAPDILPADQLLTKKSDDVDEMNRWIGMASADPMYEWAGYFDMNTKKLVRESVGNVIKITPSIDTKSKVAVGMGIVGAIGILALMAKR